MHATLNAKQKKRIIMRFIILFGTQNDEFTVVPLFDCCRHTSLLYDSLKTSGESCNEREENLSFKLLTYYYTFI